jgi:hypothetical protein
LLGLTNSNALCTVDDNTLYANAAHQSKFLFFASTKLSHTCVINDIENSHALPAMLDATHIPSNDFHIRPHQYIKTNICPTELDTVATQLCRFKFIL